MNRKVSPAWSVSSLKEAFPIYHQRTGSRKSVGVGATLSCRIGRPCVSKIAFNSLCWPKTTPYSWSSLLTVVTQCRHISQASRIRPEVVRCYCWRRGGCSHVIESPTITPSPSMFPTILSEMGQIISDQSGEDLEEAEWSGQANQQQHLLGQNFVYLCAMKYLA